MRASFHSWRLVLVWVSLAWAGGLAQALAFSGGGHKFVSLVAWQQMSPQTRDRVVAMLMSHPLYARDFAGKMSAAVRNSPASNQAQWLFAQAAVWPDMARDHPQYDHPKWHYVNLPVFLTVEDAQALSPSLKINTRSTWHSSLDERWLNALQVLDRVQKTYHSPALSDADRAVFLCWVMHLVGDLHQPLHCTSLFSRGQVPEGDLGGNLIQVQTSRVATPTKLHGLWDGLLGFNVSHTEALGRVTSARTNLGMVQMAEQAVQQMSPLAWAREGVDYAWQYAYVPQLRAALATQQRDRLEPILLPPGYASMAGEVARMRALIGGYRLARFLEELQP